MSKTRIAAPFLAQEVFPFDIAPHRRGPRRTKASRVPHSSREEMRKGDVAHVTVKLKKGLRSLRRKAEFAIIRLAIARVNEGTHVRIVAFSVRSDHLHLVLGASN